MDELDEMDEVFGVDDSDESYDEYDEAVRKRGSRPPVKTAPRGSAYQPRPAGNAVTQAQLQAALARVNSQIATNSGAIRTLDSRVRTVSSEQDRQAVTLRKMAQHQKKETEALRKEIQSTREMAAISSLLNNPLISILALSGNSLTGGGTGMDSLLPLLALTGTFGNLNKSK